MNSEYSARRGPTAWLSIFAGALLLAACSGGNKETKPTATPQSEEPTPAATVTSARPKACDGQLVEVCDAAAAVEVALRTGAVRGFDATTERAALDLVLDRPETLHVTALGCPFAAVKLGCGPSFGVAVSSVTPGVDARGAGGVTYVLVFIRDADCDVSAIYSSGPPAGGASALCKPDGAAGEPLLAEVKFITDEQHLNALVNGGFLQGGTLAGRPKGITDTHVRSEWVAYPDVPAPVVPDILKGVQLGELKLGPSVPLDQLLFIATGCWGCDGPTSGLDRVYPLGGTIVKEAMTLPQGGVRSIAVRPGTQEVILVTCDKDYCGGLGPAVTDMISTVHRSVDGGVSWQTVGSFDDYGAVGTFTPDGYVVEVWTPGADAAADGTYAYFLMPGRREVRPPAASRGYDALRVLADGSLAFQTADGRRWLRADGSVGYEVPLVVDDDRVYDVEAMEGAHLISWSIERGPATFTGYQVLWRAGKIVAAYVDPGSGIGTRIGQWLSYSKYIGNVFVSDKDLGLPNSNLYDYERSVPAYVDLGQGVVNPIDTPFFEANYRMNRTYVLGSWPGDTLARVNAPGDCLNLREAASVSSKVVTCLKHGTVLALDQLGGAAPDGWVRVSGPTGETGHVATEFLDR